MFLQAVLETLARNTEQIHQLQVTQETLRDNMQEIKRNQQKLLQRQSDWRVKEQDPPPYHIFS